MFVKHPTISWAQRLPHIYLTIEVEDMKIDELSVNEDNFKIRGSKGDEKYEADLKFFGKLKGEQRRQVATDRHVELIIPKEKEEWWPRLLQEKTKAPWIKVDFNKWVDEDDEASDDDMGGMMPGGMPGGIDFSSMGLGDMSGAGDMNFDNDDGEDDDDVPAELEDIDDADEKTDPNKPTDGTS